MAENCRNQDRIIPPIGNYINQVDVLLFPSVMSEIVFENWNKRGSGNICVLMSFLLGQAILKNQFPYNKDEKKTILPVIISQDEIMKRTRLSEGTIKRARKYLITNNWINIIEAKGKTATQYFINIEKVNEVLQRFYESINK